MSSLTAARLQLGKPAGLPALLDAAYRAFAEILSAAERCDDEAGTVVAAFAFAAAAAADGRDAIASAPSLPRPPLQVLGSDGRLDDRGSAVEMLIADLAELSRVLAARLSDAARAAAGEDAAACRIAASYARQIAALTTRNRS